MKKSILYSLFKIGSIPEHVLVSLNEEGIVLSDEGVSGWFIAKNVKGPGKRFLHRSEYFSGWLAITNSVLSAIRSENRRSIFLLMIQESPLFT